MNNTYLIIAVAAGLLLVNGGPIFTWLKGVLSRTTSDVPASDAPDVLQMLDHISRECALFRDEKRERIFSALDTIYEALND